MVARSSGFGDATVGKLPSGDILFFYRDDVRKTEFAERFGDEDDSGSVYRRVDDFQVVMGGDGFGRQRQRMNGVEVDRRRRFRRE